MSSSIRDTLHAAARAAMKQRDRDALAVYRTALAAIDNAEAVPASSAPDGSTEVARRILGEADMVAIVRREADERATAAASLETTRPDAAERLIREARQLRELVAGR